MVSGIERVSRVTRHSAATGGQRSRQRGGGPEKAARPEPLGGRLQGPSSFACEESRVQSVVIGVYYNKPAH